MQLGKKRALASVQSIERQRLIAEIRKAEQDWIQAEWTFHHALGEDHVDYAIYCLEAAEKRLSILLRQAKWQWNHPAAVEEGEGIG